MTDIKVATNTVAKIQEMIAGKRHKSDTEHEQSVVYKIPCKGCDQSYVGKRAGVWRFVGNCSPSPTCDFI